MLITRGFGVGSGEPGGPSETIYVAVCDPDVDITGSSSSRFSGREVVSHINANNDELVPILSSKIEDVKTTIDVTHLKPSIRSSEPKE